MAWIEAHQELRVHRKTLALAEALEIHEAQAVGHLMFLWWWALDNAREGVLPEGSRTLATAAGWPGDPVKFVQALVGAGWIERKEADKTLVIHDWFDFAGKYAERRGKERTRLQEYRRGVRRTNAVRTAYERRFTGTGTTTQPLNPPSASTKTVEAEAPLPENGQEKSGAPKAAGAKRFVKPTPEQVTAYAKERGWALDGKHFCDFYEARGWLLGKTPMKDWRAAVRTWEQRRLSEDRQKAAKEAPRQDARQVMAALDAWKPGDKEVDYERSK